MPFIGQEPLTGAYHVLDSITASATATYNLQLNSGAFSPATANQLLVSLNGVIQKPGSSFTISGSQITFSSALTSSDSIDFIIALGDVLNVGTPTDGTVSTSKIANDAVTGAKIENNPTIAGNLATGGTLTSTGLITASAGVALGGTGAANTLDDYEEGTFTATMSGSGGGPSTPVTVTGTYTKNGQMVRVGIRFGNINTTGASGAVWITGMPFAASETYAGGSFMSHTRYSLSTSASNTCVYIAGTEDKLRFYQSSNTSGWSSMNHSAGSSLGYLYVSFEYPTSS